MLLIFTVVALFGFYVLQGHGAPLTNVIMVGDLFNFSQRSDDIGERKLTTIILNCLTTIFACTWTAIHPNVPSPIDSGWTVFKRRTVTAFYVLLVPEAMLAWALRQNLAATQIADQYNREISKCELLFLSNIMFKVINYTADEELPKTGSIMHRLKLWSLREFEDAKKWFQRKPVPPLHFLGDKQQTWTATHGFFLQMGGFILSENGQPIQVLDYRSAIPGDKTLGIADLIEAGMIDVPQITEDDINDRRKSNFISKTVILFQVGWFISQCIARWSTHLPVTQLEIITLGFAVLNGITYICWWKKPQGVERPVYLPLKKISSPTDVLTVTNPVDKQESTDNLQTSSLSMDPIEHSGPKDNLESGGALLPLSIVEEIVPRDDLEPELSPDPVKTREVREDSLTELPPGLVETKRSATNLPLELSLDPVSSSHRDQTPTDFIRGFFYGWNLGINIAYAPSRPISKMLQINKHSIAKGQLRVSVFYSSLTGLKTNLIFWNLVSYIGTAFGVVHFIPGWFIVFPSLVEKVLWLSYALWIIFIPPLVSAFVTLPDVLRVLGISIATVNIISPPRWISRFFQDYYSSTFSLHILV